VKKIKLFTNQDKEDMEEEVNGWIEETNCILWNISLAVHEDEYRKIFTLMVVYE